MPRARRLRFVVLYVWFAHNLAAIHTPLLVLAVYLHARNVRGARRRGDRCKPACRSAPRLGGGRG